MKNEARLRFQLKVGHALHRQRRDLDSRSIAKQIPQLPFLA
jgi:hypothetical protein